MAYKVRYLPRAVRQLDEIFTYIDARSPASARRVTDRLGQEGFPD